MTKRTIFLVLAITMLATLVLAAPAFARSGAYWAPTAGQRDSAAILATGGYPTNTTFTYLVGPDGSREMAPGDGTPHRGYVDTSGKCKVCHAVHGAGMEGVATEKLLRSTVADSCAFCHITNQFTSAASRPYDSMASYSTGASGSRPTGSSGHVSGHRQVEVQYQGCASCHSVHGAESIGRILKNDPAKGMSSVAAVDINGTGAGWGAFIGPVDNQRDFCQDCHNGLARYNGYYSPGVPAKVVDLTEHDFELVFEGCASNPVSGSHCHSAQSSAYNSEGSHATQFGIDATGARDGKSHIMTQTLTNPEGEQVAWVGSAVAAEGETKSANSCATCHVPESGDAANPQSWPHLVSGQDLIQGHNYVTQLDVVCGNCHTETGSLDNNTQGVGKTF